MDIFVIHSGCDRELVSQKISSIKQAVYEFNPLMLENGGVFWKTEAKRKIKKAQMILFFVGRNSNLSKNIDWEIEKAISFQKPIYTIKLCEDNVLNAILKRKNAFSGCEEFYSKNISEADAISLINAYVGGEYKVFNQDVDKIDKTILLEQYKVFLQTSEELIARRQNVNNFYITVNSALMAGIGLVWALDISVLYKSVVGILLFVVGIILSLSWIKLLESYGDLNGSKMKIISYIEKQLPASLFDAEWAVLSDKLNKRKYTSFTQSEKRIPMLFILVYIICVMVFVMLAVKG